MTRNLENLLDLASLADRLNISPRLLGDPAWRRRVGLAAIKVGGALRFAPSDVERWLKQRHEAAVWGQSRGAPGARA